LAGVVRAAQGHPVPPDSLHITLAFLGSVPEGEIGKVEAVATRVASEIEPAPVQVTLETIDYWKKAELLCATARAAAGADSPGGSRLAAAALAEVLKSRLSAAGFSPDLKPFRPHVTLARKVAHGSHRLAMQSVIWTFTEFALVESRTDPQGAKYQVLRTFPWVRAV
jgi:RNA 2',3'-cyclic 3'-phosphodiesterase